MEYTSLQRQAAYMKKNIFDQGYLDEPFYQLEGLQDEVCPNFVEEVVTLFFRDSARLISNIEQFLERCPQDFRKLDAYMHQFTGSNSRCVKSFQKVKREHSILRQKLEAHFQLLRQIGSNEKTTFANN